jgi:glutathione S-transferase
MTTALILHQPAGGWGEPSMSPFCMKLECWLRMTGIPFEIRPSDMRHAPKGKIPYVDLGGGRRMGDSQLVIEHLEKVHGVSLDRHLTAEQRATARAFRRMIEEGTYFTGLFLRWGYDPAWPDTRAAFAKVVPSFVVPLLPLVRRKVKRDLVGQGTARHTPDEIFAIARADLDAVLTMLGDKPFFFGESPCTLDATLYGFTESILAHPYASPIKAHLAASAAVAFRDRVRARYFPKERFGGG